MLEGQGITANPPGIPVSRAVHSRLYSIGIAAEELKPKYMQGYGEVSDSVASKLSGVAGELQGLVVRLDQYLAGGARISGSACNGWNGQAIILASCPGSNESRQTGVLSNSGGRLRRSQRAEDRSFEIAVFGRVSSGKSSLLNTVLGTDVLPVGVTPVTAVPTRISHGEEPSLTVAFTDAPAKSFEIVRLGEFATEQQNARGTQSM